MRRLFGPSCGAGAANIQLQIPPTVSDITGMSSPSTRLPLLSRWSQRSTLSDPGSLRVEVCPPSLCHAPDSGWQRFIGWLLAPAPAHVAPPLSRMPGVRADFLACLHDVPHSKAAALAQRIDTTRSLRELWHLRTELYRVVALAHSQTEAERRVARLNHHFPTRAPRSQFAPLP
jgi:hypothetical protein